MKIIQSRLKYDEKIMKSNFITLRERVKPAEVEWINIDLSLRRLYLDRILKV